MNLISRRPRAVGLIGVCLALLPLATTYCDRPQGRAAAPPTPATGPTSRDAERAAAVELDLSVAKAPATGVTVRVDGEPVAPDRLTAVLKARAQKAGKAKPALRAAIVADGELPHGDFQSVLIAVAMAEISPGWYEVRGGESVRCNRSKAAEQTPGRDGFGIVVQPFRDMGDDKTPELRPPPMFQPMMASMKLVMGKKDGQTKAAILRNVADDLDQSLQALLKKQRKVIADSGVKEAELIIYPAKTVPYREVIKAYAAAQAAGFDRVMFEWVK